MNDLISRVKSHVASEAKQLLPPAPQDSVLTTESKLGFKIPEPLRSLYLEIANGGFGPGYGIIGVEGGHAPSHGTLAEMYREVKAGAEYLKLPWPDGLLPFCEWGCNIASSVDCADPNLPVFQSDHCDARPTGYSLTDFFTMWLDGVEILDVAPRVRRTATIINPFTRKSTRVFGGSREE